MSPRLQIGVGHRALWLIFSVCALLASSQRARAQNTPLISGGIGFLANRNGGQSNFEPVVAPLIAWPLGNHLLVESRADLRGLFQETPTGYPGSFTASLQYLQLDYVPNSHLSVVVGKFLTPFNSYNERLTPIWIPLFQDTPLSYGIGTRTSGSSVGGMFRGSVIARKSAQLNYIAYISARSHIHEFPAARTAGTQVAIYFPPKRLEIGTSYQRFLQNVHNDSVGLHVWWLPPNSAVELRSEYAHGARSQAYWIELGYRLSRFHGPNSLVGRFEPAFRMQQTFRNLPNFPSQSDTLPAADTQQLDFGFDYHLPQELRLNSSYSRSFSTKNKNLWDLSITYRFLFPTWRGSK